VCVEDGDEIDPCHEQIVAHIVLALHAGSGTEIGADGDIGSTGYIAEEGELIQESERGCFDIQISSVIPDRA